MSEPAHTRVSDLGALPKLVADTVGPKAVKRIFDDQEVPLALLDRSDAILLYRDCLGLYARAARITEDRSFGLRVGADIGIRDLGVYGQYVASAPNLKHALVRTGTTLCFHESYSNIELAFEGPDIKISYSCLEQGSIGWQQVANMVVHVLIDIVRCFVHSEWLPKRIEVSYPRGPWEQDLEDHFGMPVIFDQQAVAIVFSHDLLDAVQISQPCPSRVVTRADVARQGKSVPNGFLSTSAELVRQRLIDARTDLDGAAVKLGIGPRTFQRRLSDEGISYNRLLAGCRKERAIDLLAEEALSMADISQALGYASQTQFTRAFKRWTGTPPCEFRHSINDHS